MPTTIKIHPEIIFTAKQKSLPVSGFRIWFIAKYLDNGNGNIPIKIFRRYLKNSGFSPKNISRWIEIAIHLHLLEKVGTVYRLASWEVGARISGRERLYRGVIMPIDGLFAKEWLAHVYSAFLIHFRNTPVTKETIYQVTGIPPRTQNEYERKIRIPKIANYADFGSVDENPEVAISLSYQEGSYLKAGRIRKRLGNSYLPKDVKLAHKGRLRQINAALRIHEGSSQKPVFRLYCENEEEVKRAQRAIQRKGDYRNQPDFIFQFCTHLPKGAVWHAIQC